MPAPSPRSVSPATPANIALAKAVLAGDAAAIEGMAFSDENPFASTLPVQVEGKTAKVGATLQRPVKVLPANSPADPNAFFGNRYTSLLGYAVRNEQWAVAEALLNAGANPFSGTTTVRSISPNLSAERRSFQGSAIWDWRAEGNSLYPSTANRQAIGEWVARVIQTPRFLDQALTSSHIDYRADLFLHLWSVGTPEAREAARRVEKSISPDERCSWLGNVVASGNPTHVQALAPALASLSSMGFGEIHKAARSRLRQGSLVALWQAIQCRPAEEWADWLAPIPGESEESRHAIENHRQLESSSLVPMEYSRFDGLLTTNLSFQKQAEQEWRTVLEEALTIQNVGDQLRERWPVLLGAGLHAQASKKMIASLAALVPADRSWATLTCLNPAGKEMPVLLAAMPRNHQHVSIEVLRFLEKKGAPITEEVMAALAHQITYTNKLASVGKVFLEWSKKAPFTEAVFDNIRLESNRETLRTRWRSSELGKALPQTPLAASADRPRF